MTICGYHPSMGEGIQTFAQGLTAALREKAKRNGLALGDQLSVEKHEIAALSRFLESVLSKSRDQDEANAARGFLGLVYVCRYLMRDLADPSQMQADLATYISGNSDRLIDILKTFETEFESIHHDSPDRVQTAWSAAMRSNFVRDRAA